MDPFREELAAHKTGKDTIQFPYDNDGGVMKKSDIETIPKLFRPHPWHGLDVGPSPPDILNVFVEITPFDLMKSEIDKLSGYLRVDRPQRGSSQPPAL